MSDAFNAPDGVTADDDRVVVRVRARLDDEDASGGPADANGANNVDGRFATNRAQIAWEFGTNNRKRIGFGTVDIVEPTVDVTKSTVIGSGLTAGDTATFELHPDHGLDGRPDGGDR